MCSFLSDGVYGIILDFWKHGGELLKFHLLKKKNRNCQPSLLNLKDTFKEFSSFKILVILDCFLLQYTGLIKMNFKCFLKFCHWISHHWLMDFHFQHVGTVGLEVIVLSCYCLLFPWQKFTETADVSVTWNHRDLHLVRITKTPSPTPQNKILVSTKC